MPKVQPYGANKESTQQISNQRATGLREANTSLKPGLTALVQGVDKYQQQVDETAAEEALIEFERKKNQIFFDPKEGYFNKQGRNAYDLAKPTSESLTKLQNEYADKLQSPRARDAFKRASDVHVTRAMADIDKHSASGLQAYETATRKARVENTLESASLYWNNAEEAAIQNEVGRQAIIDNAAVAGIDAEATNEMLQTYESEFVKQRIAGAMGANDLSAANKMFESMGDRIEGKDRIDIEQELYKANFDTAASSEADKIINSGADTLGELMTMIDGMPSDKPEDVALKSEVQRLVTNRHTVNERIKKEQVEEVYQNHAKNIQDGAYTSRKIPAKEWNTMTFEQRARIKKMEKQNAKGTVVRTDQGLMIKLLTLPQDELAKIDPTEYFSKLSKSDYGRVVTAHIAAKKGDTKDPVYMDVRTTAQRGAQLTQQVFGKTVTKLSGDDVDKHNALMTAVQTRINAEVEANNGKKISPDREQQVYDDMAREVVIKGGAWFGMGDKEISIDDFDAADIKKATRILNQNNKPISSVNIIRFIQNNPKEFED